MCVSYVPGTVLGASCQKSLAPDASSLGGYSCYSHIPDNTKRMSADNTYPPGLPLHTPVILRHSFMVRCPSLFKDMSAVSFLCCERFFNCLFWSKGKGAGVISLGCSSQSGISRSRGMNLSSMGNVHRSLHPCWVWSLSFSCVTATRGPRGFRCHSSLVQCAKCINSSRILGSKLRDWKYYPPPVDKSMELQRHQGALWANGKSKRKKQISSYWRNTGFTVELREQEKPPISKTYFLSFRTHNPVRRMWATPLVGVLASAASSRARVLSVMTGYIKFTSNSH